MAFNSFSMTSKTFPERLPGLRPRLPGVLFFDPGLRPLRLGAAASGAGAAAGAGADAFAVVLGLRGIVFNYWFRGAKL